MELHGRSVHGVGPFFYIGTFGPGRNRIGACGDISSLQALQRRRPGSPGGYRIVRAALSALEHVESQFSCFRSVLLEISDRKNTSVGGHGFSIAGAALLPDVSRAETSLRRGLAKPPLRLSGGF
jgi:hypothetical protein